MKLYGAAMSPYVQRALMVARLKGCDLALDSLPGIEVGSPEFLALSPTGRIPLLEIAPGRRVCESEAIAGWLDETLPGPSVIGADPDARAHAREVAAIAHNDLGAGIRPVLLHEVFGRGSAEEAAAGRTQIAKGLDAIGRARAPDVPFAASGEPGWGDAMLAPMLTFVAFLDRAAGADGLIGSRAGLAAYFDRARGHAVVGRSVAEIESGLAAWGA